MGEVVARAAFSRAGPAPGPVSADASDWITAGTDSRTADNSERTNRPRTTTTAERCTGPPEQNARHLRRASTTVAPTRRRQQAGDAVVCEPTEGEQQHTRGAPARRPARSGRGARRRRSTHPGSDPGD